MYLFIYTILFTLFIYFIFLCSFFTSFSEKSINAHARARIRFHIFLRTRSFLHYLFLVIELNFFFFLFLSFYTYLETVFIADTFSCAAFVRRHTCNASSEAELRWFES